MKIFIEKQLIRPYDITCCILQKVMKLCRFGPLQIHALLRLLDYQCYLSVKNATFFIFCLLNIFCILHDSCFRFSTHLNFQSYDISLTVRDDPWLPCTCMSSKMSSGKFSPLVLRYLHYHSFSITLYFPISSLLFLSKGKM